MRTDADDSVKARLFGADETDGMLKQVIKARLLRELRQPTGGEDTDEQSGPGTEPRLEPLPLAPVQIGRFTILRKLGQGGMGVVYAAFDEQLDRKVAIKLLRRGLADDERGRVRMLREAQALARLSHPNVVQVHEVGRWRDHDYVAMEFIAGRTLDAWLSERDPGEPRPWREVLAVLAQAGRGLAAAHARELVHRDFKPANVMVGDEGRVRVLDFGLARSVHERDDAAPIADLEQTLEHSVLSSQTSLSAFDRELTATGAVLGTPAYMGPEQHQGRPATVLSDQFSFGVVLYEALFGERPFKAHSRAEYAYKVGEGKFEVPGPRSGVPAWLRKAVLRTLAPEPSDRWPSMDALLAELTRERGRGLKIGAIAAGFAALLSAGLMLQPEAPALCEADDEALAGVWDEARRADLQAAFAASGLDHADRTLALVEARIDQQAGALVAARAQACEARWVQHDQTDAQLALRNECLDQRTRELRATLDVLTTMSSGARLEHAFELLEGLGDVGFCEQVDLLEAGALAPKDAAAAEQIAALRDQIADAHALRSASDLPGAWAITESITPAVEALDYGPLQAELAYLRGRLEQREERFDEARASLLRAATLSEEHGHLELAPSAWTNLAMVSGGRDSEDPERSTEYAMARASLQHLKVPSEDLRWHQLATALSHRLIDSDRAARAVEVLDDSIRSLERVSGPEADSQRAWELHVRGAALETLAQTDAAIDSYRRAWALAAEVEGDTSLMCANIDFDLGVLLLEHESSMEEGLERLERARSTHARVFSPSSSRVAMADLALANHALIRREYDRALTLALRARDAMPPGHPDRSWALDAVAVIQMNRGDWAAAEVALDEAVRNHLEAGRSNHTDLAFIRTQIGHLRNAQGRHADALVEFAAASEIYGATLAVDHPAWAEVFLGVGEANLAVGQPGAALGVFERALPLIGDEERKFRVDAEWGCARSLSALGDGRESVRHAENAQALLEDLPGNESLLNEIEGFLAEKAG